MQLICRVVITCFLVISISTQLSASNLKEASKNYFDLRSFHYSWNEDVLGKGAYYRRLLYNYLLNRIGKNILTDYNFTLISPESIYEKRVQCRMYDGRWLHIIGEVDIDSIKKIIGNDASIVKKWWRSGKLLAVSGRIRKFRIDINSRGKSIVLYLDNIRVLEK